MQSEPFKTRWKLLISIYYQTRIIPSLQTELCDAYGGARGSVTMWAIESCGSDGLKSSSPEPDSDSPGTGSDRNTSGAVSRGLPKTGNATHWNEYFCWSNKDERF